MVNRRVIGLTVGIGALLTLALGIAAALHSCAPVGKPVPFTDIQDLSRKAALQFPPGSKVVDGYLFGDYGWGNIYGYARVELPPDQVTTFFKQPVFGGVIRYAQQPPEDEDDINVAENPHDRELLRRWNLMQVKKSASASGGELNGGLNSHFPIAAFVDLDHPEHPILYLRWYN